MSFIDKIINLFIQQIFTGSYYVPKLNYVQRLYLEVDHNIKVIMNNYSMNDFFLIISDIVK